MIQYILKFFISTPSSLLPPFSFSSRCPIAPNEYKNSPSIGRSTNAQWSLITLLNPSITSYFLPAINFARTQGDSWWVQQTERAKSNICSRNAPATRPRQVKRTPRPWLQPPTRPAARQRPAPHRCRGSRKHHQPPRHPEVAVEAAARLAARSYPRTIPTWPPGTSVTLRDAPYPGVNEVRFFFLIIGNYLCFQGNPQ